jgi:serine/threonine protein kinase
MRGSDALWLDLMRRFGENLLSVLEHLEQEGIAHRDIKPDNIGIAKVRAQVRTTSCFLTSH